MTVPLPPDARTPPKVPRPTPAPIVASPAIEALRTALQHTAGAAERAAILDAFWAAASRTPLTVPSETGAAQIVTFLWRDSAAAEVMLFVNRLTDERNLNASLMHRVPHTDVWHLAYRMSPDWRASYGFVPRLPDAAWPWREGDQVGIRAGLDRALADPRAGASCRNRRDTLLSVVELPAAPAQPWLARRSDLPGRGEQVSLSGPDGSRLDLYLPPAAAAPTLPAAVCVLLDGEYWRDNGIADTLDNLQCAGRVRPTVVVLPESGGRAQRWRDLDSAGDGSAWIAQRLLPWVHARFAATGQLRAGAAGLSDAAADTIVAGQSLGGYTALRTALEYPGVVGGALSQSASLWQRELLLPAASVLRKLRFYLEVGSQEWVLREPNLHLAQRLSRAGAGVQLVEYNGGHDYACWRGGIADGLQALLGPLPTA